MLLAPLPREFRRYIDQRRVLAGRECASLQAFRPLDGYVTHNSTGDPRHRRLPRTQTIQRRWSGAVLSDLGPAARGLGFCMRATDTLTGRACWSKQLAANHISHAQWEETRRSI
jgi:hypothetical protein